MSADDEHDPDDRQYWEERAQRLYESWDDETKARFWKNLLGEEPFRMEARWTNDHLVPKHYGSEPYVDGPRFAVPMPPGPLEEGWKELERRGFCAHWIRHCRDWWGTSRLAGAGRLVARVLQIKPLGKPEG